MFWKMFLTETHMAVWTTSESFFRAFMATACHIYFLTRIIIIKSIIHHFSFLPFILIFLLLSTRVSLSRRTPGNGYVSSIALAGRRGKVLFVQGGPLFFG